MRKLINFIKSMFEYRDKMNEGVTEHLSFEDYEQMGAFDTLFRI